MSKTMSQTTGGHNLRARTMTVILAVMLLVLTLVVVVQTIPTTSDSSSANPANQAMSADRSGGSSITHDPYIDRHTEVVARHNGVIPH